MKKAKLKLKLSRETVRNLTKQEMPLVAGGCPTGSWPTLDAACPTGTADPKI